MFLLLIERDFGTALYAARVAAEGMRAPVKGA